MENPVIHELTIPLYTFNPTMLPESITTEGEFPDKSFSQIYPETSDNGKKYQQLIRFFLIQLAGRKGFRFKMNDEVLGSGFFSIRKGIFQRSQHINYQTMNFQFTSTDGKIKTCLAGNITITEEENKNRSYIVGITRAPGTNLSDTDFEGYKLLGRLLDYTQNK